MLKTLSIRDYALIDELEVEFGGGLNVITGETGAGKSILLGALKLILGERASTEAVRTGAKKAVVEGVFDEARGSRVEDILRENEIEPDPNGVVIVRREVSSTHSRAFVNDTPATLNVLRDVAEALIDLHGQHEHQSLLQTDTHVGLVDEFGQLGDIVNRYRAAYASVAALRRRRADLVRQESELRQQQDLIDFQIREIDRVSPVAGEDEALMAERRILDNAERLHELSSGLNEMLYDGADSIYDRIAQAREALRELASIDGTFEQSLAELEQVEIIIEEAAKALQDYGSRIDFSPERVEEVRTRLAQIDLLKRKYGGSLQTVLEHRLAIEEKHALASDFEGALARLDRELDAARQSLGNVALELSARRRDAASRIETLIVAEMAELGMPDAAFEVRMANVSDPDGPVELQGGTGQRVQAGPDGIDVVEFYVSTNPGVPPRPLAKVASGGEISRIMLALKTILARTGRLPILVFDEIDVGISGETARKVGESMHRLGASHQIIAITHLPQIAALGDQHFLVEKTVDDGRTRTAMRKLDETQRARQVAALVSGESVSEAALTSARELIAAGRRAV